MYIYTPTHTHAHPHTDTHTHTHSHTHTHTHTHTRVLARFLSGAAAPLGLSGAPLESQWNANMHQLDSKSSMNGYGPVCCSAYVSKGCTTGTRWSCVLLWSL